MAEPKTRPTDASVDEFIAGVADETRRNDAVVITALMAKITKQNYRGVNLILTPTRAKLGRFRPFDT